MPEDETDDPTEQGTDATEDDGAPASEEAADTEQPAGDGADDADTSGDAGGAGGDEPGDGGPDGDGGTDSGGSGDDDRTDQIDRLYERLAELEDEVEGSRASKDSVADLREELAEFEDDVQSRTVDRDEMRGDLKRYVRRKLRRGHARGWGPYVVLLYGTVMTLGLLYTPRLQGDGWVVLAMIIIWLSTLGLYVLFVIFGLTFSVLGIPGRLRDRVQEWRSS
ncbi:ribonuclease BN [Haloarchaeobius sp. FL176]|uniref:ribonuclease BN n=1 Tax=Haloarchaeobius sp. FL176 TaxID=2967129 RepID=UPI002148B902|nr:ribonuclease BN [Haloarchaeobius sp. FL176]